MKKPPIKKEKAKELMKQGETYSDELAPRQQRALGAAAATAAKAPQKARTNLGGSVPPAKPIPKQTPKPTRQMAIGERPILPKTAAKIEKMRRGK